MDMDIPGKAALSSGARTRFEDLIRRATEELLLSVPPEAGAARAAARLVVALRDAGLSGDDLHLTASVVIDLLEQTSAEVRSVFATEIGALDHVPSDVVERLACDDDLAVAQAVIAVSPVLDDEALLRIVREKTVGHRLTVASRPDIGTDVAVELATRGEEPVLRALANNTKANLPFSVLAYLAVESTRFPGLAQPLICRGDLPAEIHDDLVSWVVEVSIEEAVEAGISGCTAMEAGRRAVRALCQDHGAAALEALATRAVAMAADADLLSARFVRDAFEAGTRIVGVVALARMAGVSVADARRCVDSGLVALVAVLCRAADIPHGQFLLVGESLRLACDNASGAPSLWCYETTPRKRAQSAVSRHLDMVWGETGFLRAYSLARA
jgi:uncharacterized protein (DUF2336 family)